MIRKLCLIFILLSTQMFSQSADSSNSFWHLFQQNKSQVENAVEVESLFPMFFYGGYHLAVGYRFSAFRVRVSVIKGGSYDVEPNGIDNSKGLFKRFYSKPGYGIFFGYNVLGNWEIYTYLERHSFGIEQSSTTEQRMIYSTDYGIGTSYQLFIGRWFYIQPGFHLYIRASQSVMFSNGAEYKIPTVDISPVIRIGIRLWQN